MSASAALSPHETHAVTPTSIDFWILMLSLLCFFYFMDKKEGENNDTARAMSASAKTSACMVPIALLQNHTVVNITDLRHCYGTALAVMTSSIMFPIIEVPCIYSLNFLVFCVAWIPTYILRIAISFIAFWIIKGLSLIPPIHSVFCFFAGICFGALHSTLPFFDANRPLPEEVFVSLGLGVVMKLAYLTTLKMNLWKWIPVWFSLQIVLAYISSLWGEDIVNGTQHLLPTEGKDFSPEEGFLAGVVWVLCNDFMLKRAELDASRGEPPFIAP